MDNQTRAALTDIQRRLQNVFDAAYHTAIRNHKAALRRLTQFDNRQWANLEPEQIAAARHNYVLRLERAEGIVQNIAREIASAGDTASRLIRNEGLNIAEINYNWQLNDLRRQMNLRNLPLPLRFDVFNREQIRVLMGGLPSSPFTQVAYSRLGLHSASARQLVMHRLQNSLLEGVLLGEGIQKITNRIRHITNASFFDARRIARTELLRTANQGRFLAARQTSQQYNIPLRKRWIAADDERTRDAHAEAHFQTVGMNEPFIVMGEELQHPLDPSASAKNVINCRCVSVYLLDTGFESEAYRSLQEQVSVLEYRQRAYEQRRLEAEENARASIRSDSINKTVNSTKQNRHYRNSEQYIDGRSYLFENINAQELVDRYHGTGDMVLSKSGNWQNKEIVVADGNIGISIDPTTGGETITNRFTIHYSRTGTHVVPAKPRS